MDIPSFLVAQIRDSNAVLVFGAGASRGARPTDASQPPHSAAALARAISAQFLGGEFADQPLTTVSEYAINESSLSHVQGFIRDIFEPLEPSNFHLTLPTFKWHGLATTNFDRVIEKTYDRCSSALQRIKCPVIQNGDGFEDCNRDPDCVLLLKLHGCISRTAEPECPLILTHEQYVTHKAGRHRLFRLLEQWAYERPLVFIGHSINDRPTLAHLSLR